MQTWACLTAFLVVGILSSPPAVGSFSQGMDEWSALDRSLQKAKSIRPKNGFVPDESTAIKIGEAVAVAQYGEDADFGVEWLKRYAYSRHFGDTDNADSPGQSAADPRTRREKPVDKQVAALIERMLNKKTEQKAFSDLEALGCPAVPAIIAQMDDRRTLPVPRISLKNKSPDAFEGMRHYGPQEVVDALAAILNQITGQDFGFISNGATDKERTNTIQGWRDFLKNTPSAKLCAAG